MFVLMVLLWLFVAVVVLHFECKLVYDAKVSEEKARSEIYNDNPLEYCIKHRTWCVNVLLLVLLYLFVVVVMRGFGCR